MLSICILSSLVLSPVALRAQKVIRIIEDYVLIDTDIGIGGLREEIPVYRSIDGSIVTVGQVRIVSFRDGLTAAKVVSTEPGFEIRAEDYVRFNSLDALPEEEPQVVIRTETVSQGKNDPIFGIHLGMFLPASYLDNTFSSSFSLGLSVKLMDADRHHFYVDATYPVLKTKVAGAEWGPSSLYVLNIVDHIQMGERIHFDVGGGLYIPSGSDQSNGQSNSEPGTRAGFFLGLSIDFFSLSGWLFSPRVRYHAYNSTGDWNEFAVGGLNVYFSIF